MERTPAVTRARAPAGALGWSCRTPPATRIAVAASWIASSSHATSLDATTPAAPTETCACRSSNGRSAGPSVHITSSTDQPSPLATSWPAVRPGAPLVARRANAWSKSTAIFPKTPHRLLGNVLEHQQAGAELATPVAPGRKEDTMSTVSGLDPNVAAPLVDQGYGPGAWHGPNLKAALTDIAPRAALWRPGPGRHNVAEIALHHAWCVRSVIGRLTGDPPEPFVLEGEDWFDVSDGGRLDWPEITAPVD